MTDVELLQEYARTGSETAFAELVKRHAGAVYGSALRQVGAPHLAEEVMQAVFILLARKASGFRPGVVLSGWLFRAARFAANDLMKAEIRRQRRETVAYNMNPTDDTTAASEPDETLWERVSPVLDQCLSKLGDVDRNALLLRFFENKPLAEVGQALGIAEDAARKRVSRALEKLQRLLVSEGATVSVDALSPMLTLRPARVLPSGLAAATVAAAVGKGAAARASTTSLATSVGRQFLVTQVRNWVAAGVATAVGAGALAAVIAHPPGHDVTKARSGQIQVADNYRPAGFDDAIVVHQFIERLQEQVRTGDPAAIAAMVKYPLRVNSKGETRVIQNAAEFLASFGQTFRPEVVSMILKCPRTGLYCDVRGVMIGTGEVWLAPEDREPRIIAVNLP